MILVETSYDVDTEDAVDRHNLSGRKGVKVTVVPVVGLKYKGLDPMTWKSEGKPLVLCSEPENKFDSQAIAAYCGDSHIGYIPKDHIELIREVVGNLSTTSCFPALMTGETPTIFVFTKDVRQHVS